MGDIMNSIWLNVEKIKNVIGDSLTRKEVLTRLDRSPTTSMYKRLKKFEMENDIDTSHFKPYSSKDRYNAFSRRRKLTYEEIFCKNSTVSTRIVKQRIIKDALFPYRCAECPNDGVWNGKKLQLQLEHKDGISNNHELVNLCFLCPNCHSQTSTFCGRNAIKSIKEKNRTEYLTNIKKEAKIRNQPLVDKLLRSDIDFSKYGWVQKAASLIDKTHQKIKQWMMLYMPDFYINNCYHQTKGGCM
jgi:5-methylcytosine-specific restriction endonuclease McrA